MRLHARLCVCVCLAACVCACGKEASKEQDYLWAIEVAYAFSWRELMHTQASKQAGETGIDRGGIEGTARTHYECGSRQRKQRQSEARKQQRQTQTLRQRQRQTQTEAA